VPLLQKLFFCALFFGFLTSAAQAAGVCDEYRKSSPTLYAIYCKEGSSGGGESAKPAGANSTFSDGFNISSASLPTEPSSYGIESIGSVLRSGQGGVGTTFSLIKGFHRFGSGISTGGNNGFYGDDVVERLAGPSDVTSFKPAEAQKGYLTNLNLGTSVELVSFQDGPSLKAGGSLRYNETTNTWGGGPAVFLSLGSWSFGAGYTEETISNNLNRVLFTTYFVSTRISNFELEYTYITDSVTPSLEPIQIFTVTATYGRFIFLAAIRHLNYLTLETNANLNGDLVQEHFSVQFLISTHFSLGYLYNYIPGANSLGLQVFL
jgi:hypothetical protein